MRENDQRVSEARDGYSLFRDYRRLPVFWNRADITLRCSLSIDVISNHQFVPKTKHCTKLARRDEHSNS